MAEGSRFSPDGLGTFLDWILPRHAALGGLTEIRILRPGGGVWSALVGPGDAKALVTALAPDPAGPRRAIPRGDHPRSGEAGIYFSLHAVQPSADRPRGLPIRRATRTAKDRDIRAYSLMVVDVDPVRQPPGRSASDAEKVEALAVIEAVRAWFAGIGVHPVLADSGNGYHLLVPLVAATGDDVGQAATDAQRLLVFLDGRFSTPGAKVDRSTFNPSRILKLYGTAAVKGEDTPVHPHRLSAIDLSAIPEDIDLFTRLAEENIGREPRGPAPTVPAPVAAPTSSAGGAAPPAAWTAWRAQALARLPLDAVYGGFLTGRSASTGWLQCRDPWAAGGDKNPSASVADGTGEAERGTFHSFIRTESLSAFDFLIRRGQAGDFTSACARVAELASVPLPQADPGETVATFRTAWAAAATPDAQTVALSAALARLTFLPALAREPAIEAVREASGLSKRVFLAAATEARQAAREDRRKRDPKPAPARPNSPGLPIVDFVENRDTVEGLFDAIVTAILPANRFFRFERDIVFVRRGFGPRPVDERSLPGLVSALVEVRFLTDTEDGIVFQRFDVLPADLARAFVHSPRVAAKLPVLSAYARSPVFDKSWNFVGKPGYHPASGIFYDGPEVKPAEGVVRVLTAVQDFPWKDTVDMVNFIGALLTTLTMPHWGRGHPFLAINGNKPGVGKSTLARLLGVVAEGTEPTTVTFSQNEEEFEKQLATRIDAGDRVVVIDNAKTKQPIQSPILERCISDTRLNFRRLGGNTAISRPTNDVLFVLTMNLTQMGPDLRRRALPLNLEIDGDVRRHPYPSDDPVGDALDARHGVVAELAGMVAAWVRDGRTIPENPATHSTSRKWAATIDAILRLAGFDGFLSNFTDSEHAFDPDYELLAEVCAAHHADDPRTAADWAALLVGGLLEEKLTDGRGNAKPARSQATLVGQLFAAYLDGATFPVGEGRFRARRDIPRKGHPPVYCFEPAE